MAALACGTVALAQTPQPVAVVASAVPDAKLSGERLFRYWGFSVYTARLWVSPGFKASDYAAQPFALELAYLRDFAGADIADRSLVEMKRVGGFSDVQGAQWLARMKEVFPNIKKGETLTGVHQPGVGARFFHNGKPLAEVRDAEFSRRFFGIWLGSNTSEPELRTALLAGAAQ